MGFNVFLVTGLHHLRIPLAFGGRVRMNGATLESLLVYEALRNAVFTHM
jgi:hypothetical protein